MFHVRSFRVACRAAAFELVLKESNKEFSSHGLPVTIDFEIETLR